MKSPALSLTLALCIATPAIADEPAPTPAPAVANPNPVARATPAFREITPLGAAWRSTLIPGWGQRYKGETRKGWMFTGAGAVLLATTLGTHSTMESARREYYSLPANASSSTVDAKYDSAARATLAFDIAATVTAAFWTYNVAESSFTSLEHLRFKEARVRDVYPAVHKFYETNPIAVVGIENRSGEAVSKVRVKFEAPDILDLPAESEVVDTIPAGLGKSLEVTAAFNKKIFEVGRTEPKAVQAKLTVTYEVGRKKREIVRTTTFTVHNRNAIVWDDMRKMAAFVTPRDEAVKAFVAATMQNAKDPISSVKSIADAAAYFDALAAHGMVYVTDPQAPFTYFDGNAEAVDYLAYPRETLTRKTGDCDDLTALYASMLESTGIPSALVDVPGHVYLMFDSGLTPEEMKAYVGSEDAFHVRNGTAWVPVEVTAVGKPFHQAWALGAAQTKKWTKAGKLELVDVVGAQATFPSSAPDFGAEIPAEVKTVAAAKYAPIAKVDRDKLQSTETAARNRAVQEIKSRKLSPAIEANEIGIVHARDGNFTEAQSWFTAAIRADPTLARAYNNLANLAFLRGQPQEARNLYETALSKGENALVLVNYAQLEFDGGNAEKAKDLFGRAARIEPVYKREFPELAALLGGPGTSVASGTRSTSGKASAIGRKDPRATRWIP